jgi:ubiquitin-activating enzyme E1
LAELNAYVPVRDLGGKPGQEITVDLVQGFQASEMLIVLGLFLPQCQVVVLCGVSIKKQLEINDWAHNNGVHFISAETRGLFG